MSVSPISTIYFLAGSPSVQEYGPAYDGDLPRVDLSALHFWLVQNSEAESLPPLPYLTVDDDEGTLNLSERNGSLLVKLHSTFGWSCGSDCHPYLPLFCYGDKLGVVPRRLLKCDDPISLLFMGEATYVGDDSYDFSDFRRDVAELYASLTASPSLDPVSSAPPSRGGKSPSAEPIVLPSVPDDDDVDQIVSMGSVWEGAAQVLARELERLGYAKFVNLLSTTMGLTGVMKGIQPIQLDERLVSSFGQLMKDHKITKSDCISFYKENCGALLQLVRQNVLSDLRNESVICCNGHVVVTDKRKYDFSTLAVSVCQPGAIPPPLSLQIAKNCGATYKPNRLRAIGMIQFSLVQQWAMFAAFWTAAKRDELGDKVFEFQLPILSDDRTKPRIVLQTSTARLANIPVLPSGFESASKEMQCACIVRALASGDIKGVSPYLSVGSVNFNPYMFYLDVVAVKFGERYAPLMALERARKLRAKTVMDGATENAFMFHRLSPKPKSDDDSSDLPAVYVPYSSEVARAMHICAYLVKMKAKHVLWVLQGGSATLSVVDKLYQLREKYGVDFRFTFGSVAVPDVLNQRMHADVLVDVPAAMEYLSKNGGTVVWLQNPSNNDYLTFSEPKDTVSVTQTNLLSKAVRVIKLVCFAKRETFFYGVNGDSKFEILDTDVGLPYSTYYAYKEVETAEGMKKTTYVEVPLVECCGGRTEFFVPLGHNAHSSQRVVSYEVGTAKMIYFGRPDEKRYPSYGIWETVVMSQRRDRAMAEYYSEEIAALGFSGKLIVKGEDVVESFDEYE